MNSATYSELLRNNKNFRRLWTGQVISELGTWFSAIAELGLMRLLSGSTMMTAALLVARTLPFLLVSPLAGVAVDRGNRKRILIAADLLRAVLALGYLTTNVGAPAWTVVLITALMTSTGTFFEAAKNATIANVTTRQEMLTANVLMFGTRFLQLTLGAALGGLTAAKFGYNVAFVINALSFVASAYFIWQIPGAALEPQQIEIGQAETPQGEAALPEKAANKFWRDVREGFGYIWAMPFVRGIILVNVGWATGGGMNNLLFDRMAGHEFAHGVGDRGDTGLAVLWTAAGAGLFIGMMLARRAGAWAAEEKRAGLLIGWALLAHGILWASAGLMPSLWTMALAVMASRTILGAEFGVQETLVMRVVAEEYRGRVFTTDRALELTTMTLSMLAGGLLLRYFTPRQMMMVSGLLSASPGLVWLLAMWLKQFSVPSCAVRESYSEA
ncbi:MAG: MFS transporter [Acidobacteria bacterium]|nr:MFS transporter [Acidobacteriota bacterium]MBI3427012.1 MFS transporter [Acidobacteriota bacterium]